MVTQKKTQVLQETTTWSIAAQQSKQFRWHNTTWNRGSFNSLFMCSILKYCYRSGNKKKQDGEWNKRNWNTSCPKGGNVRTIIPVDKPQPNAINRLDTTRAWRNRPHEPKAKFFYLTSTSVNHISPGTKKPGKAWSHNLRNTYESKVHLLFDLWAQRCALWFLRKHPH